MLVSFLNSIEAVVLILLLTAVGYFCAAKKWFTEPAKAFLSKFIMNVAVPFMCIYTLRYRLTREMIFEAGPMLLVPFLCMSILYILSFAVCRLMRLPRKSMGVFMMMASLSNTLFIGYPMCTELFGEEAVPYIIMYYLVGTIFSQGLGITLIRFTGDGESGNNTVTGVLKKLITTPPIIGIIIGIAVVLLDIQLPDLVMTFSRYMNQVVTPLALLVTGKIIYDIGLKNLRIDFKMLVTLIFRFLLSPGLCFLFCSIFGIKGLAMGVFMAQAAMPVVSQTVVAAAEYKADEEFAARGAAITTIASFVVIPLLMLFLSAVG